MPIPAFLTRNLQLKALSTGLALVGWFAVVYSGNPPETRTVAVHVPQDATAVPAKYLLVHPIPDVPIRVIGRRDQLSNFNASSIRVSADFGAITGPGRATIPLTVTNRDPDVELDLPPTAVEVDTDTLMSASKPVQIVFNPPPPRGYIAEAGAATPPQVVVTGPRREVDALTATVTLDMSRQKTALAEQAAVVLSLNGRRVGDVGVSPATVQVSAIVRQSATSRASAVVPPTAGTVAPGHRFGGITVDPPTVILSGSQDLLNSLDSVATSPIDLAGLSADRIETVDVVLPAGVAAFPDRVTVHVTLLPGATPATP